MKALSKAIKLSDKVIKENVLELSAGEQEDWLLSMGGLLHNWTKLQSIGADEESRLLYTVHCMWDSSNGESPDFLKTEAKGLWNYNFYDWAKAFTKKVGREPSQITIDSKIKTYDYWQKMQLPETIFIPIRDEFGRLLHDENDPDGYKMITPDPDSWDYSKKVHARGIANRGEMTPDAWTRMADPYSTVESLNKELSEIRKSSNGTNKEPKDDFSIYEVNGIVYGSSNGDKIAVMEVLWENDGDELFSKTLRHILKAMGIEVPLSY